MKASLHLTTVNDQEKEVREVCQKAGSAWFVKLSRQQISMPDHHDAEALAGVPAFPWKRPIGAMCTAKTRCNAWISVKGLSFGIARNCGHQRLSAILAKFLIRLQCLSAKLAVNRFFYFMAALAAKFRIFAYLFAASRT